MLANVSDWFDTRWAGGEWAMCAPFVLAVLILGVIARKPNKGGAVALISAGLFLVLALTVPTMSATARAKTHTYRSYVTDTLGYQITSMNANNGWVIVQNGTCRTKLYIEQDGGVTYVAVAKDGPQQSETAKIIELVTQACTVPPQS